MTKPKTLEQLRADKERDRDAACTGTAQVGASGEQKEVSGTGRTGRNFDRNGKDHAAQRGRDAFGSTPDQAPKEAKYAVLIPGPGMFVNVRNGPRVVIPPPSETPRVSPCKPLCAILFRKPSVYPLLPVKANVGRL